MADAKLKTDEEEIYLLLLDHDEEAITRLDRLLGDYLIPALRKKFEFLPYQTLEEVYADTLLRIWEKREQYDPEKSSIRTWAYVIANGFAIDRLRKCESRAALKDRLATIQESRSRSIPAFVKKLQGKEEFDDLIRNNLFVLSGQERRLVLAELNCLPDTLSGEELQRLLGFNTRNQVYAVRSRAYGKLRERIQRLKEREDDQ